MLPSYQEGLPRAMIEAMSFGLPVIGGEQSGGVPWVLDYGNAGLLADISSPTNMVEKMTAILGDKHFYLKLRIQSIQRVKKYSPKTQWQRHTKTFITPY